MILRRAAEGQPQGACQEPFWGQFCEPSGGRVSPTLLLAHGAMEAGGSTPRLEPTRFGDKDAREGAFLRARSGTGTRATGSLEELLDTAARPRSHFPLTRKKSGHFPLPQLAAHSHHQHGQGKAPLASLWPSSTMRGSPHRGHTYISSVNRVAGPHAGGITPTTTQKQPLKRPEEPQPRPFMRRDSHPAAPNPPRPRYKMAAGTAPRAALYAPPLAAFPPSNAAARCVPAALP